MSEQTAKQSALMALIEKYAEEKAHHFYDSMEGGYQCDTKADMDEALKAVEAIVCGQAEVVWPELVAYRHGLPNGRTAISFEAFDSAHAGGIYSSRSPLYTRSQIQALLVQQKGQA